MACDHWRREGVLEDLEVRLVVPGPGVLGLRPADETLSQVLSSYGVEVLEEARVARLDPAPAASPSTPRPALGHSTASRMPTSCRSTALRAGSPRAGWRYEAASGLVDIDAKTLRHARHESIWALGDAADIATRPSGGALRPQVEVLGHNITAAAGEETAAYDGYTVMPITTSRRRLMLLEVDREGHATLGAGRRPGQAAPVDVAVRPVRPPGLYFRRILRGRV